MRLDTMILVFWMLSFKPTFSLSSFTFIKRHFSSSSLSAIRVVSSAYNMIQKQAKLIFVGKNMEQWLFLGLGAEIDWKEVLGNILKWC